MAYQINRFDNSLLTTVQDGTINSVTDLKLVGRNFAGYGEIQNENFLFLLENFSGINPPPKAIDGQIWYDSGLQKLKFYDGVRWRTTGGSEVQSTQPAGLTEGDFWWDSANEQLYVFNGTNFVLIGPQNAGDGITQFVSRQVLDTQNQLRSIIQAVINDEVAFIISYEGPFDLSSANPIPGFDRIRQGITLIDTKIADNGVTSSDFRYWGTASNADRLGGFLAEEFIKQVSPNFQSQITVNDQGIAIGDSLGLKIFVDEGLNGIVQNEIGPQSEIHFITTDTTENLTHSVTINELGIVPPETNVFQIGSPDKIWNTVYASEFNGEATRSRTILVLDNNTFVSGRISATANTAAIRDSNGNLNAVLFQGTATQARYADLAEKYTVEQEWPVGTAMAVSKNNDFETEPAESNSQVIGVISENPAYLMNSESQGQAIALKGRVPVRVRGKVLKGDSIYVQETGVCSTIENNSLIGVALESNFEDAEKLVECVLKT